MTEVLLDFHAGTQDRSAPLTWAQRVMWGPIQWFGAEANQFNITAALPLPAPVPRPRMLDAFRALIEGHQTLRAHFAERDGEPRQLVAASGQYDFAVVEGGAEPLSAAEKLATDLAAIAFDHAHEWPLRVGLVLDDAGRVAALALAASHLALDGWSFNTVCDLLLAAVADGRTTAAVEFGRPSAGAEEAAHDALQPLEQAEFQQSPGGERLGRLALRHWEQALAAAPHSMLDLPRVPTGELPIERHILDSAAVTAAATALAARTRTTFSTVLLSLTALVLTAYNGHDTCVFKLIAGNRLDARNRGLIGINAQDALLAVPIDRDVDLLTAIRAMQRPAFDSYRRAQYDPQALEAVIEQTGRRRGVKFDLSAYFNNGHRGSDWPAGDTELSRAELDRLRAASRYSQAEPLSKSDMKFYVTASTTGRGVCRLTLMADTAFVPAPIGETMLRGMEQLLCDAVVGEVGVSELPERLGIRPAVRGNGWIRTAAGWLNLDGVTLVVSQAAGGAPTVVRLEPGPGDETVVVAYVAAPRLTPDTLHERVLAALTGEPGTAAPHAYVICDSIPRTLAERGLLGPAEPAGESGTPS